MDTPEANSLKHVNLQPAIPEVGKRGFTLIELLVVITVISLLLAFAAPALFSGLQASRLTGAGERMLASLSEAQQVAFSQNCAVEVRFYSYLDPLTSTTAYRSFRLFKITNPPLSTTGEQAVAIGSIVTLPQGVVISPDANFSPSLSGSGIADSQMDSGVPGATYTAIRFLPDGTCRKLTTGASGAASLQFLTLQLSFLTLLEDEGGAYSSTSLPKNFFTIQTDPYTGKSRSYRPGF